MSDSQMGIITNLDMCGIKYINLLNELFQVTRLLWKDRNNFSLLLLNKFGEPCTQKNSINPWAT